MTRSDCVIERTALNSLRLPRTSRVLDAPCGEGSLARDLIAAGFEVWGLDLDSSIQGLPDLSYKTCNLNGLLPFEDSFFDGVVSVEGIEHLENPFRFLREISRVLRPGGTLVLTTPNIASLRSRVRFLGSAFFNHGKLPLNPRSPSPMNHINLMTYPELRYALNQADLIVQNVTAVRIKAISYLYLWLAPWMATYTAISFRKESDPLQKKANHEILRHLYSWPALLGENLVMTMRKGAKTRGRLG